LMRRLAFVRLRGMNSPATIGIFGSGCDEYVYRRGG